MLIVLVVMIGLAPMLFLIISILTAAQRGIVSLDTSIILIIRILTNIPGLISYLGSAV